MSSKGSTLSASSKTQALAVTTNHPLVSIITPSFNQAQYLEETIQSVLSQDYANMEYLIADGGSRDGSLEIIQRYAGGSRKSDRLTWWVSEPDRGQTDALNKGFAHAKGDILAWLNSDDTYQPNAISQAVDYLQSNPQVGMVYGDANLIDEAGKIIGKFPARQTDYRRLRQGYVHIPQQASFFRARLWKQVGPLDPTFYFAMDYDLWVRLARISLLSYYPLSLDQEQREHSQPWANFRLHGAGKSVVADDRCWPEMLRVHYRDGGSPFSRLVLKARLRPLLYAWLPLRLRVFLRRML